MSHLLLVQSCLTVLAIIAIITFFLIYSRDPQGLRRVKYLDRTDIIIMAVITLVYAGVSIINLGSFDAYTDNSWHGKSGDELIITPDKPIAGKYISYAIGVSNTAKYSVIAVKADGREDIISPVELEHDINVIKYEKYLPPYYFSLSWLKTIKPNINTKYNKIIIKVRSGELNINKMFISNEANKMFTDYNIIDKKSKKNYNYLKCSTYLDFVNKAYLYNAIFDEIYYPIAAYQYLHGGIGYVGQHPQLGIFLIGAGIHWFGMSPFGWRFMPWLSGVILVTFMYLFAKRLFENRKVAIIASILISTEFMHFVMTRVGLIETFFVLFVFIECFFLYQYLDLRSKGVTYKIASRHLLLMAVFFGFAVSCKWSALFSLPIVLVTVFYTEFILNRTNFKNLLSTFILLLIALFIYTAVYIVPAIILKVHNLWGFVYIQQKLMLSIVSFKNYAPKIRAVYGSVWWKWPFNVENLMFCNSQKDMIDPYFIYQMRFSHESVIMLLTNPLISTLTYLVLIFLTYDFFIRKKYVLSSGLIFLMITSMLLPYAFITRSVMLYYFYSVLPFIILGISAVLNEIFMLKIKKWNYLVWGYVFLNIIIFIFYYPIISGLLLKTQYIYFIYNSVLYFNLLIIILLLIIAATIYMMSREKLLK